MWQGMHQNKYLPGSSDAIFLPLVFWTKVDHNHWTEIHIYKYNLEKVAKTIKIQLETLLIHKFIQWPIMGKTISTSNGLSPIQCIWHLEQCFCIQCELMFTSMRKFTQLQLVEALVATNISYNLIIDRVTIQFLLKLVWLSYFFKTWINGPIL